MPKKTVAKVPIRLDLSPDERQQLRVIAAEAGLSMAEYARELVRNAIEKKRKKSSSAVDTVDRVD